MNLQPKCSKNNACFEVCSADDCKAIPFMCTQKGCECASLTRNVSEISGGTLLGKRYLIKQLNIRRRSRHSMRRSKKYTATSTSKLRCETLGFNQIESEVCAKIKECKFNELNGHKFSKLYVELKMEDGFTLVNVEADALKIKQSTALLTRQLDGLLKTEKVKTNWLNSKITDNYNTLCSFFLFKNLKFELLYRASQNQFSTDKFHELCDGIEHTLVLVKTEFNKIIGGYTPLVWDKSKTQWMTSTNRQSFVFSLSDNNKLVLNTPSVEIYNNPTHGPRFGSDLIIYNQANVNQTNQGAAGNHYRSQIYTAATQQLYTKFCGNTAGYVFKALEWEVHRVKFI